MLCHVTCKARSSKIAQILLSYGADPYLIKVSKDELKTAYDVFLDKNAAAAELLMNNGIASNDQGGNSIASNIIWLILGQFLGHFWCQ